MAKLRSKRKVIFSVILFTALLSVFFLLTGDNVRLLKELFAGELSNEELRDRLMDLGLGGYIAIAALSMVQVVCTVIPAEPIQVLAGLAFGFPVGLLCCAAGVLVGNTVIFVLYKTFGNRLRDYFTRNLTFDFEKLANSSRIVAVILLLYFLPAIPYGMICFFAAGLGMRYHRYITATFLGAIPSICIGVGLGNMTLTTSWVFSLCVFLVLIALLILLSLKREWIFAKINAFAAKPPYSSRTTVQPVNPWLLLPLYLGCKLLFLLRGVRVKSVNKVGHPPEKPSIVLCNHGSFIDFLFAETLLLKVRPNFVVARLYFYHKFVGWLLRQLGCFPKSMFALDLESTKNCLRVLKEGRVLAMMPEARLSTAGTFEDIQDGTFAFLKKSAVPVYTVKLKGDYLANPKWGKGFRRGSIVEAELDILFTPEELKALSVAEIQQAVEGRLYYDEHLWLDSRPELRYRSKRMAEGLENILTTCPKCGRKFCLTAKGKSLSCEHCGTLTTIDGRYRFAESFPFPHPGKWYEAQRTALEQEILADPDYVLESKVQLRLPSQDGRSLTRPAGEGICRLDRRGLTYTGTLDGKQEEKFFPIDKVYRLLFGAGENFEVYQGNEIHYFVPQEPRSCVQWYMASAILHDHRPRS